MEKRLYLFFSGFVTGIQAEVILSVAVLTRIEPDVVGDPTHKETFPGVKTDPILKLPSSIDKSVENRHSKKDGLPTALSHNYYSKFEP